MLNAFEVVGTWLRTNLGTQCTLYACVISLCLSMYLSVCVCFLLVLVRPFNSHLSFHYFNSIFFSSALLHIKFIFFSSFFLAFFVTISVNWKFQKELHKFIKVSTTNFVCCTFWVFGMQKFLIFNWYFSTKKQLSPHLEGLTENTHRKETFVCLLNSICILSFYF